VELRQTKHRDLVFRAANNTFYTALRDGASWQLSDETDTRTPLSALNPATDQLRVLTFGVEVRQPGQFTQPLAWNDLTIATVGRADSVTSVFAAEIPNRLRELETPLVILGNISPPLLARGLIGGVNLGNLIAAVVEKKAPEVTTVYQLSGGNDGQRPVAGAYAGDEAAGGKTGLAAFEDLEDISIIAAPGVTFEAGEGQPYASDAEQVTQQLIVHCERMRYRVAVLDSPNDQSVGAIRTYRASLDNTRAALYYPWVRILDPLTREELNVPPSGFVAGIYARNDTEKGVHKAPANEVVLGAIGLEAPINQRQQEVLNPLGINCLRFFENRGNRVWGARTISSDPEWKYLNIRRFFAYLEASIERSTQWAVFEPNGEALWANVRRAVSDFLFNEWKSGHLAGTKPEEAYFVQCDRSTMTQNDLDNGRMICLIGVAPLYPAEFVIFRIGQWTGDRRA
jgi:phage tail sheath protein FI